MALSRYHSLTALTFAALSTLALSVGLTPQVSARSSHVSASSLRLAHGTIDARQSDTLTVTAVDLAGKVMAGAHGTAVMKYGAVSHQYTLPKTNTAGKTVFKFKPPAGAQPGKVSVHVTVSNGALEIQLSTSFKIAGKVPVSSAILAIARALPPTVTAPQPVWVLVYAHDKSGVSWPNASVKISVAFGKVSANVYGKTGLDGVATIQIPTALATTKQVVKATITVTSGRNSTKLTVTFTVNAPSPTPTATRVTSSGPPSPNSDPPTPTPTPTDTPAPVDTPTPTSTDPPLQTPTTAPTSTPTSTPTPTATDTPTPTATDTPTVTPTPQPSCGDVNTDQTACEEEIVNLINASRQQYAQQYGLSLGNLTLSATQSNGTGSCVGSIGHSQAMQQSGSIWHQNPAYPQASFWNDICGGFNHAGENVGEFNSSSELTSLQAMHNAMMQEPHDPTTCASTINHGCNIVSGNYTRVGVGILVVGGTTWLTEDFVG